MREDGLCRDGQGSKPVVVFLHSSAGSPRQWRLYMERLALRYRVVAPPLIGYGTGSEWRSRESVSLDREAARLEPWLYLAPGGAHLVGHSYGAAVALHAALRYPQQVRSLAVYEPVLFNLLLRGRNATLPEAASIAALRAAVGRQCAAGNSTAAARVFVDYWSGDGAWDSLSAARQQAIAQRMDQVDAEFEGVFADATPLARYGDVRAPVLCLYGERTRSAAKRIAQLLASVLRRAQLSEVPGVGHLGPITHADALSGIVRRHLDAQSTSRLPAHDRELPLASAWPERGAVAAPA